MIRHAGLADALRSPVKQLNDITPRKARNAGAIDLVQQVPASLDSRMYCGDTLAGHSGRMGGQRITGHPRGAFGVGSLLGGRVWLSVAGVPAIRQVIVVPCAFAT